MLAGRELGFLVKGVGVLGHVLYLGEGEILLGQEVVYGLWVLGRDVVDLGEVFLLRWGWLFSQSGGFFFCGREIYPDSKIIVGLV